MAAAKNQGRRLQVAGLFLVVVVVLVVTLRSRARAPGDAPAAATTKLADVPVGVLSGTDETPPDAPLLVEDFRGFVPGRDGSGARVAWHETTSLAEPLDVDADAIRIVTGDEDGRAFVTLSGRRAGLYRIVPVEPSTPYAFRSLVRARGLVAPSEDGAPFQGAKVWIGEFTEALPRDELFAEAFDTYLDRVVSMRGAYGREGWTDCDATFRTGPRTRALVVTCLLSVAADVAGGEVDFAELELTRLTDRAFREHLVAGEVRKVEGGLGELDGWRAERRVKAELGAEMRPSIHLFPGERLSLLVDVPDGAPHLESGIGPSRVALADALAALPPGETAELASTFTVTVEGAEAFRRELPHPARLADARWHGIDVDLSRWAGERVRLELAVDGDVAGVFGAPTLRDGAARDERWNVVVISIDTLRADHVGTYGYGVDTTPRIDAFAREAIVFEHATSQAPYTLPSHATLFSGQFPSVHGIQIAGRVLSEARSPILARILSAEGYRTQAFTGGGFLDADFGFDAGFDGFVTIDPWRDRRSKSFDSLVRIDTDRLSRELVDASGPARVLDWIDAHDDAPFFLFVHTFTVHDLDAPPEWRACAASGCTSHREDFKEFTLGVRRGWTPHTPTEADRAHLSHLYDEALRYVDSRVGELLDHLGERGLMERTIVVLTSDHGEEMFERGFVQHGKTLYEELTDVPLILYVPGARAGRDGEPAMLADVTPTILAALGLPSDPRMQGGDLLAPERERAYAWSEIHDDFVHRYSLTYEDGWKLVHSPDDPDVLFSNPERWELYDLGRDPGELDDRAAGEPARLDAMRDELERRRAALQALGASLGDVGAGELDEATLLQLEALGYGGK